MRLNILLIFLVLFVIACNNDDEENLPPYEERVEAAIEELRNELTAPSNGWRVNYQPTPQSGVFFMILNFDDEGMVTIKTDVIDEDGEYIEHTIPYRIDNALSLELIFETYGVFHYLFEKDQSTFGAEFEFIYSGKQGDNLVFVSKSDLADQTVIVFEPAAPGDEDLFSTETVENLDAFYGLTPKMFGQMPPMQQLVIHDKNLSVFWTIDLSKRVIMADMAGVGTDIEEIETVVPLNHSTGYALRGSSIILTEPISFELGGEAIVIDEIQLTDFNMNGEGFCSLNPIATPEYEGHIEGLGSVTLQKSLFNMQGNTFQPGWPYTVNVVFVFDEEGNSLYEEGIILDKFPNASGFVFAYGFESEELPPNAIGFIVEDEAGEGQIYLREFEPTSTVGNKISINFTEDFYYTDTPGPEVEQDLREITDIIFEGGEVYAYKAPELGAGVFRLYNPCNQYEIFLVQ